MQNRLSLAIVFEQQLDNGKVRKYPVIEKDENTLIRMLRLEVATRLKHVPRLKRSDERLDALIVGAFSRIVEDVKKETIKLV